MLVGNAGLGKSVLVNNTLASLPEEYMVTNVPFNYYTTSEMLQGKCANGYYRLYSNKGMILGIGREVGVGWCSNLFLFL